jgi:glutathione S-transferase
MNTSSPNSTIRLYHVSLSPFCRKVRLVLAEKRIEVELVEDRYWEPDSELMRRNPAGKLPVLRMDGRLDGRKSGDLRISGRNPPAAALMPRKAADRYEVRRLCAWFDDKFNAEVTRPVMNERVWKKVMRQGYPDSRTVKAGLSAIRRHMDYMRSLLEHRRWLAGRHDDAGRFHRRRASVLP